MSKKQSITITVTQATGAETDNRTLIEEFSEFFAAIFEEVGNLVTQISKTTSRSK